MRAYVKKNFYDNNYRCHVEVPKGDIWILLDNFTNNEQQAIDWLTGLGYRVVTREQSYERQEKPGR